MTFALILLVAALVLKIWNMRTVNFLAAVVFVTVRTVLMVAIAMGILRFMMGAVQP